MTYNINLTCMTLFSITIIIYLMTVIITASSLIIFRGKVSEYEAFCGITPMGSKR